ncbi:uncharacterized protein GJ701_004975 [Geothlypis trichas]
MEPTNNQNSDNSWKNDRNLLRILEQERRRRLVPPDEDELLARNPPLFLRPYKTDKEDELSRRIKRVLGDYDPRKIPIYYTLLDPIWIPKNPKSDSQAHSHRPASSKTNPYKDIRRESSRESLGIAPNPEQNYNDSNKGLSNRRSEAKAPQSEILPELVKKKKPIDVSSTEKTLKVMEKPTSSLGPPRVCQSQDKRVAPGRPSNSESRSTRDRQSSSVSALPRAPATEAKKPSNALLIEKILREMTTPLPPLLPPLQMPTRAETSKRPSATKESQPDGSAAQKLKQANTASETLPNSQPRTSVCQSQDKRVAPAQPSNSESRSTRDRHSSSVCGREISSSHSEEDSRPKPEPSSANKWFLGNLMAQAKEGTVLRERERLRKIPYGTGHEEGVKQEQGISSSSCQQHSKAREPPHKSCGQVAMDFHKTFAQEAKDSHKISGQMTKHFHKTSGQVTEAPRESHVMSTHSSLKPLVHTKEALWVPKIVGIKRPSQPLVHDKSRKLLKLESEPGPFEVRDHSSKDKLKVQEAENTELAFRSGLKLGVQKHFEKSKHKDPDKAENTELAFRSGLKLGVQKHFEKSKHKDPDKAENTKLAFRSGLKLGVQKHFEKSKHKDPDKAENTKLAFRSGLKLGVQKHFEKSKHKNPDKAENTKLAFRSGLKLGVQKHFEKSKHKDPDKAENTELAFRSGLKLGVQKHFEKSKHKDPDKAENTKLAFRSGLKLGVQKHFEKSKHKDPDKAENTELAFRSGLKLGVQKHFEKSKHKDPDKAENTKLAFRSGLKLGVQKHFEKSKHKNPDKAENTKLAFRSGLKLGVQKHFEKSKHKDPDKAENTELAFRSGLKLGVQKHFEKSKHKDPDKAENTELAFRSGLKLGVQKHFEKSKHKDPDKAENTELAFRSGLKLGVQKHFEKSKHKDPDKAENTELAFRSGLKLGVQKHFEKSKHKDPDKAENTKLAFRSGLKLGVQKHFEKSKHKDPDKAENTELAFRSGLKLGVQKHFEKSKHKDPDKSCAHVPKAPEQSCSQVAKAPHESDVVSKHSFLKPPVHNKEALLKNTLGIKRPSMSWVHDESKRVWKAERQPGLLQVTDQSCKDQPNVMKTMKPKATNKKDLKPTLQEPSEKRKDEGSRQANVKGFLEPRLLRHAQESGALMLSGHRPEDLHKEKVPLPPRDKKLFLPAREADLKRKAMWSPEVCPGKKKREDKEGTPRKKKK